MLTFVTLEGVRIDMDNLRASIKKFNETATEFLKREYPLAGFGVLEHTTKRVFKALADIESPGEFMGMGFQGPCTLVQLESQLYLHYHAIVAGPYKDIPSIATRWRSALLEAGFLSPEHDPLQGKHGVNMSVVRSPVGSARYLLKYVSKGVDLSDAEVELLTRLKYVRAWGQFYNPEEPSYDMVCRDCGAKCYVDFESEAVEPLEHQKLYIIALERPP